MNEIEIKVPVKLQVVDAIDTIDCAGCYFYRYFAENKCAKAEFGLQLTCMATQRQDGRNVKFILPKEA